MRSFAYKENKVVNDSKPQYVKDKQFSATKWSLHNLEKFISFFFAKSKKVIASSHVLKLRFRK